MVDVRLWILEDTKIKYENKKTAPEKMGRGFVWSASSVRGRSVGLQGAGHRKAAAPVVVV